MQHTREVLGAQEEDAVAGEQCAYKTNKNAAEHPDNMAAGACDQAAARQ
jgi:hypothetical protein